jgi:hypothetical protein
MPLPSHNRTGSRMLEVGLATLALHFSFALSASAQDCPVALIHVAVETAGKAGRIENATVILRGGNIEAVGQNIKIPEDARIIDARGKTIMPGVLDPFREVNIAGATADTPLPAPIIGRRGRGFRGRGGFAGAAFTRIADNFYPY